MKTLIAEDDNDAREVLASLLRSEGYEVAQASNGYEAWQLFEQNRFGLIITDWIMPEINGLELCRRIRAVDCAVYPYVILLSALKGKGRFLEALGAGADDFVSKPFDPEELRAKLHVAVRIVSLQNRVKTLEGILPTCMYCKKIREENQNWVSLEQYVTERSNAAFSHGVCPACYSRAVTEIGGIRS